MQPRGVTYLTQKCRALASAITFAMCTASCGPSGQTGTSETAKPAEEGKIATSPQAASSRGPFGVAMGTPISKLKVEAIEGKPGGYKLVSVPKPHTDFEEVYVTAFPETGVCVIRGVGFTLEDDGGGVRVRTQIAGLVDQLKTKYGEPKKIDRCYVEYGCDSQFWTMKLKENSRAYFYEWPHSEGKVYGEGISEILAGAVALDYSSTYVELSYYGNNHKRCLELEKAASAEAL